MQESHTDAALVAHAQQDPQAFGALYERYVGRIYSYLYYRTGNVHDAEDLTARVFQKALTNLDRYTSRGLPFSAWLYRIAHNLLANWHRDQSRREHLALHQVGPGDLPALRSEAPEVVAEKREDQAELLAAVRRLTPDRQQLLIFKFVERLSNAEIGAILNRSEGAIKSLYHRTLLALRDELIQMPARNGAAAAANAPGGPNKE